MGIEVGSGKRVTRYTALTGGITEHVGRAVYSVLAPLLTSVRRSLARMEEKRQEEVRAMVEAGDGVEPI